MLTSVSDLTGQWWNGSPFYAVGMNSIAVYVGYVPHMLAGSFAAASMHALVPLCFESCRVDPSHALPCPVFVCGRSETLESRFPFSFKTSDGTHAQLLACELALCSLLFCFHGTLARIARCLTCLMSVRSCVRVRSESGRRQLLGAHCVLHVVRAPLLTARFKQVGLPSCRCCLGRVQVH